MIQVSKKWRNYITYIVVFTVLLVISLMLQNSNWFSSILLSQDDYLEGQYYVEWESETRNESIEMEDSFWLYLETVGSGDITGEAYWPEDDVRANVYGVQRNNKIRLEPFTISLTAEDDDGYESYVSLTLELRDGVIYSPERCTGEMKVTYNNETTRGDFTIVKDKPLEGLYALNTILKDEREQVSFIPLYIDVSQKNDVITGEIFNGTFEPNSISGTMVDRDTFELNANNIPLHFNNTTNSITMIGSIPYKNKITGRLELISTEEIFTGSFSGLLYGDEDSDGDTITDREEVLPGKDGFITNPKDRDTDNDGYADNDEINNGFRPDLYDGPNLIKDVSNTHPDYKSIIYLVREDVVSLQSGYYYPNRFVTYAEAMKIILSLFTEEDLTNKSWDEITEIAETYNLLPESNITIWNTVPREHMVYMLNQTVTLSDGTSTTPFLDITNSGYANEIALAYNNGLISGVNQNMFVPSGFMTRAQFATLALRYKDKAGDNIMSPMYNSYDDDMYYEDYTEDYSDDDFYTDYYYEEDYSDDYYSDDYYDEYDYYDTEYTETEYDYETDYNEDYYDSTYEDDYLYF